MVEESGRLTNLSAAELEQRFMLAHLVGNEQIEIKQIPQGTITDLHTEELKKMTVLAHRIVNERVQFTSNYLESFTGPRNPVRGPFALGYVFSETTDNEPSTFPVAVELANAGFVKKLGIAEGDLGHGYEGFEHSVSRLKSFGLKDEKIVQKFDLNGNVNTGSEALLLSREARAINAYKKTRGDVIIIAPPFHIVRAFFSTISAFEQERVNDVRVYTMPGKSLSWTQTVAHSQGTLVATRFELLKAELRRLELYRTQGNVKMVSADEVIAYLNWRDK